LAHVYCDQTVGCIKMKLDKKASVQTTLC